MTRNIVVLGPPGAGKGTQATRIAQKLEVPHIVTGEMFRQEIQQETELGKKAATYINKGKLVPDEITIQITLARLQRNDCSDGFVLDGYPRTVAQAEALEDIGVDIALYIDVTKEKVIERLSNRRHCSACKKAYNLQSKPPEEDEVCDACGSELVRRDDDTPDVVRKRLDVYRERTAPLIKHYEKKDVLVRVDGNPSIEDVWRDIQNALGL